MFSAFVGLQVVAKESTRHHRNICEAAASENDQLLSDVFGLDVT